LENNWQGITPGYSSINDVQTKLGNPVNSQQTSDGVELSYDSGYPALPHQVVTDNQGLVHFVKEHLMYDKTHTISQYTADWGQPDLELWEVSNKAYVFLSKGMVVIASPTSGVVYQKWYFAPTLEEDFLSSLGTSLSVDELGPEGFEY